VAEEDGIVRIALVHGAWADGSSWAARVMCAVQQPLAYSTLGDVMTRPAWKTLPTWFAVAEHDDVIPPGAERQFARRMGATTVEVDSSHVVMISHPDDVTALIQSAVDTV